MVDGLNGAAAGGHVATTHPSADTDQGHSTKRPSHLRWVFPTPLVMPLGRQSVVGRDDSCDSVLRGNEISRRHAEFRVDGPIVAVRDLQSRNGVFVNGQRRADAPLKIGDVVRCGEWIGVVVSDDGAPDVFKEIAPGWFGGAALAAAVAPGRTIAADLPIIVQGETGTGKEGMARALHDWSGRRGPLVAVNCAALPADLAEAELFGYRKGAFTGADVQSPGLFRAAEGGSIFLDEILELPLPLQAKFLRVLEERRVRALGETRDVPIDVKIVVATQEPLADAVAEHRFRADLLARLDGLTLVLPPLRDRREDVAPLFLKFLKPLLGARPIEIEAKLIEALCLYDWPLNVRELVLLTRRLMGVHGRETVLKKAHLPDRMLPRASEDADADLPSATDREKRAWQRTDDGAAFDALVEALRAQKGSVAKAAMAVGVTRARAYRLLAANPDFSLEGLRQK
jgi:transcriptional regulator with AAA-type ATPase domain